MNKIQTKKHTFGLLSSIGNTPLIRVGNIHTKLETTNPSGSVKDRMVHAMVEKAEARGELKPGSRIIEATTGNTGISLAMVSAVKGYHFTAVMPDSVSPERKKMIELFGGDLVLTPAEEDMVGAIKKYEELIAETDAWLPRQFQNPDNITAIKEGLGREIVSEMDGKIDVVVAGVGTGGTLIGIALALKEAGCQAKIVAVEPAESAVLSGREPGPHLIQGIGEGFIPQIVRENRELIDEVIAVESKQAIDCQKSLASHHGLLVGISSGANMWAALELEERDKNARIVTVFPDRGERYLCPTGSAI